MLDATADSKMSKIRAYSLNKLYSTKTIKHTSNHTFFLTI